MIDIIFYKLLPSYKHQEQVSLQHLISAHSIEASLHAMKSAYEASLHAMKSICFDCLAQMWHGGNLTGLTHIAKLQAAVHLFRLVTEKR